MLYQAFFNRCIVDLRRIVFLSTLVLLNGCLEVRSQGQSRISSQPCSHDHKGSCHVIEMLNYSKGFTHVFSPGFLKIKPGDKIIFQSLNHGHNVMSVSIPEGAKRWESNLSHSISLVLKIPGVYFYKCEPHDSAGMIGVIQVGDSLNNYSHAVKEAESMNILENRFRDRKSVV